MTGGARAAAGRRGSARERRRTAAARSAGPRRARACPRRPPVRRGVSLAIAPAPRAAGPATCPIVTGARPGKYAGRPPAAAAAATLYAAAPATRTPPANHPCHALARCPAGCACRRRRRRLLSRKPSRAAGAPSRALNQARTHPHPLFRPRTHTRPCAPPPPHSHSLSHTHPLSQGGAPPPKEYVIVCILCGGSAWSSPIAPRVAVARSRSANVRRGGGRPDPGRRAESQRVARQARSAAYNTRFA